MKFPVVLHKDADSEYGVTVPDVPGCFSAGAAVGKSRRGLAVWQMKSSRSFRTFSLWV